MSFLPYLSAKALFISRELHKNHIHRKTRSQGLRGGHRESRESRGRGSRRRYGAVVVVVEAAGDVQSSRPSF